MLPPVTGAVALWFAAGMAMLDMEAVECDAV